MLPAGRAGVATGLARPWSVVLIPHESRASKSGQGINRMNEDLKKILMDTGKAMLGAAIIGAVAWFGAISGKFADLDKNLAVQAETLKRMEKSLESRIDKLESRIERLESRAFVTKTSFHAVEGKLVFVKDGTVGIEVGATGKREVRTLRLTGTSTVWVDGKIATSAALNSKIGTAVRAGTEAEGKSVLFIECPPLVESPFPPPPQ